MSKILIVDDEYLILDILGFVLMDEGYAVETAGDGEAALKVLQEMRIDLIITDYMMPRMNGAELAEKVRIDPTYADIPVILMSGAQASIGRERKDLFQAVLGKPFDPAQLIAQVSELLPSS